MVFSFMRRPKADLAVDIDGDTFLPGDAVRVRLKLSSKKGLNVRTGTVTLECVEKHWKREYDPASKSTQLREKSQKLFEIASEIMRDASVRSGIPATEDITLSVPADAHRTVIGKTVNIAWKIKVALDVPGARDIKQEQELIVVPEHRDSRNGYREEESLTIAEDSFDEGRLSLQTESSDYWLGETAQGRLRLDAQEDSEFPEVRVELIRDEKSGDKSSDDVVDVVVLETGANIRKGLSREWRFNLAIPSEPQPSTSHSNSLLTWKLRGILARSRKRDYAVEAEIIVS